MARSFGPVFGWNSATLHHGMSPFDRRASGAPHHDVDVTRGVGALFRSPRERTALVFYKALDPKTQLAPAYEVCLYPLAGA